MASPLAGHRRHRHRLRGRICCVSTIEPAPISKGELTTSTAKVKQLNVADGSQITLGGHSKLAVYFELAKSEILIEAGEAYFNVHKDPTRPFVVLARQGAITAIGTAFNVRTVEDRVTVTVTEGSVAVTHADSIATSPSTAGEPLVLKARHLAQGKQLTYSPGKKVALEATSIKHVDAGGAARWRGGQAALSGQTIQSSRDTYRMRCCSHPFASIILMVTVAFTGCACTAHATSADKYHNYRDKNFDYFVAGNHSLPRAAHTEFALALLGGGGSVDAAFSAIASHAGGGHILILRAVVDDSFDPKDGHYGEQFMTQWRPVASAQTIVFHSRAASFDPRVIAALSAADGIFLTGGDQGNYIRY